MKAIQRAIMTVYDARGARMQSGAGVLANLASDTAAADGHSPPLAPDRRLRASLQVMDAGAGEKSPLA